MLLLVVVLPSCAGDGDFGNDDIVGRWQPVEEEGYDEYMGEREEYSYTYSNDPEDYEIIMEFTSDGKVYEYDAVDNEIDDEGTYEIKDGKLFITSYDYEGEKEIESSNIVSLTSSRLVIENREKYEYGEYYLKMTLKKVK